MKIVERTEPFVWAITEHNVEGSKERVFSVYETIKRFSF